MKRNWDTIREILIKLEELPNNNDCLQLSDFPEKRAAEISYHTKLLIEAGLINGDISQGFGSEYPEFAINSLTWNGHEFLDSIRSNTIWEKTKKAFVSNSISMTFDLIKSVASDVAGSIIKSTLGVE